MVCSICFLFVIKMNFNNGFFLFCLILCVVHGMEDKPVYYKTVHVGLF